MRLFFLCAGLLAGGAAHAATWTVDPTASHLTFTGTQLGQAFNGTFARWTGVIVFDPAQPQSGSADIVIDMASAATGDSQRDTALPQPEWFDAAKFPQATFHVAGFAPKGAGSYEAAGKLTIRGIGADVRVPFTLDIQGTTAHAKGHVDLMRTNFGVGQGPWASDQYVALGVAVDFDLVARGGN